MKSYKMCVHSRCDRCFICYRCQRGGCEPQLQLTATSFPVCVVLQVGEGLVAVQRVLLPAVSLHGYFLHPDDLRDVEEEERRPDRPQRPPEAGRMEIECLTRFV